MLLQIFHQKIRTVYTTISSIWVLISINSCQYKIFSLKAYYSGCMCVCVCGVVGVLLLNSLLDTVFPVVMVYSKSHRQGQWMGKIGTAFCEPVSSMWQLKWKNAAFLQEWWCPLYFYTTYIFPSLSFFLHIMKNLS